MVNGIVTSVREKHTKDRTRVYAYDVTVDQEQGSLLAVDMFVNDSFEASTLPSIGEVWSAWVSVAESQQYGASLTYEDRVSADDLDRIHSAFAVTK